MSWAGHRPFVSTPATRQVIAYHNHGLMFVLQRDLDASHLLLAVAALSGALAWVLYLLDKKLWTRKVALTSPDGG